MRRLVILRGSRGSGRRSSVRDAGMEGWLLDQDQVELLFGDVVTAPQGGLRTDPYHRRATRAKTLELVEAKMALGSLVLFRPSGDLDGRVSRQAPAADRMILDVAETARRFGYAVTVLDYAQGGTPETPDPGPGIPVLATDRTRAGARLIDLASAPRRDFSRYAHLVFIGDIHGCDATLGKLTEGFEDRDDTGFVFLGDFINKGPSSGRVLRRLLDRFAGRENCLLLAGNHETALAEWVRGAPVSKHAFRTTALPDLERQGIGKSEARHLLDACEDGAWIRWRNLDILATHGGFCTPPDLLGALSSEHCRHGTGDSRFDIDAAWEGNVADGRIPGPDRMIQVHGHRNHRGKPIRAGLGSYNLEDGVDRGGPLRSLVLSASGAGHRASGLESPNLDMT